ncbi:MAG TPA: copper resistance CopC family protein [Oscillatoriaceae cyanobacterium]
MRILPLLLLAGALAIAPRAAWAHAFPNKTVPPVGGTVTTPPKVVSIWYTMGVQQGLAFCTVTDDAGKVVSEGPGQVCGPNGCCLTEQLKPLKPGRYTVAWHVLAEDGHPSQGHYHFTVAPPPVCPCTPAPVTSTKH